MRILAIPALLPAALLLAALAFAACGDTAVDDTTADAPTAEPGPLARELAAKRAAGMQKMPDDVKELIRKSGEELAASGLADKALKVGSKAPDFTLEDGMGKPTTLSALLEDGPVVLTFYRGKW